MMEANNFLGSLHNPCPATTRLKIAREGSGGGPYNDNSFMLRFSRRSDEFAKNAHKEKFAEKIFEGSLFICV